MEIRQRLREAFSKTVNIGYYAVSNIRDITQELNIIWTEEQVLNAIADMLHNDQCWVINNRQPVTEFTVDDYLVIDTRENE